MRRPSGPPPRLTLSAARAGARWTILAALLALAARRIDWDAVAEALAGGSVELLLIAALANAVSSVAKTRQGLVSGLPAPAAGRGAPTWSRRSWWARW